MALNTILLKERGHYHEIHVQSGSLSQDGGKVLLVFNGKSFHFLVSDKQ